MNFTEEDFPSLGNQSTEKQEKVVAKKESATEDPYAGMTKSQKKRAKKKARDQKKKKENQLQAQPQPQPEKEKEKEIFECLMCSKKGPAGEVIKFGDRPHIRFLFGRGLCVDCSSSTPEKEILYRYVGCDWVDSKEEKEKKLDEWRRKASKKAVYHITTWVNMDPSRWPCDYPGEVKGKDILEERWESLAYYATWIREKRFKDEDVAWYSGGHGKMVVGKVAKIKCGVCTVYRTPETEEEKKLGNYYTKELEEWKLFPPISQKQAIILMRNTPGGCRPEEESPFECSGCNRVRISIRSERDKWNVGWSGPNKSPYGGVFCKECYDSNKIHERDSNMHQARINYSDRVHRAFGSVFVDNWGGKPGRTFRTCSCYKCSSSVDPPPQSISQTYECESCGFKGPGHSGFFDRRSSTGGLPSTWDEEDHWFCKKCWCREYWVEGKWEDRIDGSVWFKPKLS